MTTCSRNAWSSVSDIKLIISGYFLETGKNIIIMSKKVLVYGGKGALGAACVQAFKNMNWVIFDNFFLPANK